MRIFPFPFDIAADGIGEGNGDGFAGEEFSNGAVEVVSFDFFWEAGIVNAATGVNEFARFVEEEEVGSAESTIGAGDVLCLIPKVDPGEMVFAHSLHHVFI